MNTILRYTMNPATQGIGFLAVGCSVVIAIILTIGIF